jgi:hypothetical protein
MYRGLEGETLMKVVFQEWVEEKTKHIRWSLSIDTESLAKTVKEVGNDGHSPLGEPMVFNIPDGWRRLSEFNDQGTVFLRDRHELMEVFSHFMQTR